MDTSKKSEAVITSTKDTLSGTPWSCLSDFCHFDKMTLSHFWSLGKIIKPYRKLKTIIKKKMWGKVSHIFLNMSLKPLFFWAGEGRSMTKCPSWDSVHKAHHASLKQLSSFLPWASTGAVFMPWLLSGKCWALSGICKKVWFPPRGYLMAHLPACLAGTLWALGEVWTCSEITENVNMFGQKPLKTDIWAMPNHWSIIFP